jgi:hypothetical protein
VTLIVNDGSSNLSISDGIDLIKGIFPRKILGATDSTPIGNVGDRLKVDASFTLLPTVGTTSGLAHGRYTGSALAIIRETTYSEQSSGAQRSIVSSSASDAAAGTGARTVEITYLKADYSGYFTETLTLNGTTAVNTVATDICFIEKIKVLTYGSFGGNVGVISLKTTTAGGGSTIASIAAGANATFYAHHYVPLGKTGYLLSAVMSASSGDSGVFFICFHFPNRIERPDEFQCPVSGSFQRHYNSPLKVPTGCNFISMSVIPDSAGIYYGSLDYYDL